MNKFSIIIKYLFILPCLLLCFSNVYGQCYPIDGDEAEVMPGMPHTNPASCDVVPGDPDPTVVITPPTFDCADVADVVTYETPILPNNPNVFFQYWGECATGSPAMPNLAPARNQGYIQQMFCAFDANGLPTFPVPTPVNGVINFIPQQSEDVGCNGFATGCECGERNNNNDAAELYQLDFWLAVPNFQSQIGFQFSGNRDDAASIFVGPDLNNMCEVAYHKDGSTHMALPNQLSGTYNIPDGLSGTCGLSWLRIRIYVSDIADRFRVNPEVDLGNGNGYVNFNTVLIEPAVSATDNTPPAIATNTVSGYLVNGANGPLFYTDQGVNDPLACNPVTSSTNTGICPDVCEADCGVFPANPGN